MVEEHKGLHSMLAKAAMTYDKSST